MTSSRRSTNLLDSFRHAFSGLATALRSQRNVRIHALVSLAVVGLGLWLRLTLAEWALLALAIGLVWITELLNTAIEAAIDLTSPDPHPLARISKDAAAAAVLVAALTAVVIGGLMLVPRIWLKLWPAP
jgi:diacylglycerol kinase